MRIPALFPPEHAVLPQGLHVLPKVGVDTEST